MAPSSLITPRQPEDQLQLQKSNRQLVVIEDEEIRRVAEAVNDNNGQEAATPAGYPEVWGIENSCQIFNLKNGGILAASRKFALETLKTHLDRQKSFYIGYQVNLNLHYSADFAQYLDTSLNNVGDPFTEGNLTLNTKFMERAVLDYYARLWNAVYPHNPKNPESYWGYSLTMGATEGNLNAMWNARDYLTGKRLQHSPHGFIQALIPKENPNAFTPLAFYSADTHYSLSKAITMLSIRTFYEEGESKYPGECPLLDGKWPKQVPSLVTGAIDVDALASLVEFFASRGYPIIVCFSFGTTFKGAHDNVEAACHKLKPILEEYGLLERKLNYIRDSDSDFDTRTGFWLHVDGALGAAYMPFIEMAYKGGLIAERGPLFDFRLPMVHSIVMSGHKWIGTPMPCGVYMSKVKYKMLPQESVECIGSPDTTFAGSRDGLAPLLLWDYIARHSIYDQIKKVLQNLQLAEYAETRLRHLQNNVLKIDLYVSRSPLSLSIQFKRANYELCKKYSLSNETIDGLGYSHIFTMEHITTKLIDALIHDLSKPGAFAEEACFRKS